MDNVKTGKPDLHDADMVLKLYELRREAVLRESRNALNGKFWPKAYDDLLAITQFDHPLNAAYRQVSGYWELVYSMARHGIVHADFLLESSAEGLFLYAKIQPFLERFRREHDAPGAFQNAEWAATQCSEGRRRFETIQKRVQKLAAAAK